MPIHPLHVYCADIGAMCDSKCKNNFGWASQRVTTNNEHPRCCNGKDMGDLVNHVAQDLKQGSKVALGFECPLWIPVRDCPEELTRSRKGEENSWSAPGGLGSMATGLVQVPWLLQAIHHKAPDARAFLDWNCYQQSDHGLFIWEAYVSGKKNQITDDTQDAHIQDATAAVAAFVKNLRSLRSSITLPPDSQPRSLIGAALLWAGWSEDQDLLQQSCIVIKAEAPAMQSPQPLS